MSKTKADRKVYALFAAVWPLFAYLQSCLSPAAPIEVPGRYIRGFCVVLVLFGSIQAEKAEKKAARQAGKANKKAARAGPVLLQLPTGITPSQRARVHAAAEFAGLFHESSGDGDERALRVGDQTAEVVSLPTHSSPNPPKSEYIRRETSPCQRKCLCFASERLTSCVHAPTYGCGVTCFMGTIRDLCSKQHSCPFRRYFQRHP